MNTNDEPLTGIVRVRDITARYGMSYETVHNWIRRGWLTPLNEKPAFAHRVVAYEFDAAQVELVVSLLREVNGNVKVAGEKLLALAFDAIGT